MTKPATTGELPQVLEEFAARYPQVWEAYNRLGEATAAAGPLDEKTQRLLKLAIAIGRLHARRNRARWHPRHLHHRLAGRVRGDLLDPGHRVSETGTALSTPPRP
jgi:hypothetical protein